MTQVIGDQELLESIVLGPSRGGRRVAQPLAVHVVRSLEEEDLDLIQNPPAVQAPAQRLQTIRHSHHQLARFIAAGKPDQEISLITGYSPAYISSLKSGKDFKDLIAYYGAQKDLIFVEVMERMKVLGLNSIDEIQRRFEENPDSFTNNQLMELTELMLIKPMKAQEGLGLKNGGSGGGPAVQVNVQFVGAPGAPGANAPEQPSIEARLEDAIEVKPRFVGARIE